MIRPTRVYVAGPYTGGDPCVNTRNAIMAGTALLERGFAAFVPHLSHFWHTITPQHYEVWMANDFAFVYVCDVMLRLPGDSKGADREVELAKARGIPVYHSIDSVVACVTPTRQLEPAWEED